MKMTLKLAIRVRASRPEEYAQAERLQDVADQLGLRMVKRAADFDDSLVADFARCLGDLNQLFDRASARRRSRRRKGPGGDAACP